jgi:succinate dehydrogenase / fumarate reductase cytochrome b subunit
VDASTAPFLVRHEFLIRRLHSASGLVPVGAFMCLHLATNASVLGGADVFQDNVDRIHALGPLLPIVEWAFIFLPLIFHAVVGVMIIRTGLPNTGNYAYRNNIRYTLQRATAWIALFFILYHVFHMHGWFHVKPWLDVADRFGGHQFDPHHATSSAALALQSIVLKLAYAVGILACVYHLANGIWTSGITWGLWVTPVAQRRADWVCLGFGILLAAVGLSALTGFSKVDVAEAQVSEEVREKMKEQAIEIRKEIEKNPPSETEPSTAAMPASAADQ